MSYLSKKWKQLVYGFSTEDRYADYKAHVGEQPSGITKLSNPSSENVNAALADHPEGLAQEYREAFTDIDKAPGSREVVLAWDLIKEWASANHGEILSSLSSKCTLTDIAQAQYDLGIVFPKCVIQSLRIHDGQEATPSSARRFGLIFGLGVMPLDEIVGMTKTWRAVGERMNATPILKYSAAKKTNFEEDQEQTEGASSDGGLQNVQEEPIQSKKYKEDSIPKQSSVPPGYVRADYSNPDWIPLITDYAGNHVGVDLAPGPEGTVGQVILFGREFDVKYVVAPTWGDFLLEFAKDLEQKNWRLMDEDFADDGDLVFVDGTTKQEIPYLDVLRKRAIHSANRLEATQPKNTKKVKVVPDLKPPSTIVSIEGPSTEPDLIDTASPNPNAKAPIEEKTGDTDEVMTESENLAGGSEAQDGAKVRLEDVDL
ncbi:unnamed protein product [Kuraishia capsulata CBS 1993]|uniref:Knr4/Smi1-like domain-containing protein n=1 Tax=Kuraishia capsulata CBS 1993 TaxID=1382522 RepID=W6MPD7_9ASCO|nr:uncharacterized protein KUCA_T00004474001 [Kuraishia capsulata CBS 1993]CDK28491.1 unnamed protein product [Kuraishia capsulata CBS 1993]